MTVARTSATGSGGLDPLVLAFTTSLPVDQALYAADIAGSLAHVQMLTESGLLSEGDARALKAGLREIHADAAGGRLAWADEEDVHMAVEVELTRRIGDPALRLHTARSRNDQVALDARLHLREETAALLLQLADALEAVGERAAGPEGALLMPAYTHRQRAQPITLGYHLAAWGQMLARDISGFTQVLISLEECPLGVGAVSGTSLPTRRERVSELLGFARPTANGLDTVGDRDFALDFTYAAAKCLVHLSRISHDVVDFASQEFGFVHLDDAISCGSSMMPHKKNPDLFELIRGKSSRGIGLLTTLLATVKGLPVGYMRDLQEDKVSYLEAASLSRSCLAAFRRGLDGLRFNGERMGAGLEPGETQATDLAERLVTRGLAFRDAYRAVGALVRVVREAGKPLGKATADDLAAAGGTITAEDLAALSPANAAGAKRSLGGTGEQSVRTQLEGLRAAAASAREQAANVPRLAALIEKLAG
jgi:argininosuccinate lyase